MCCVNRVLISNLAMIPPLLGLRKDFKSDINDNLLIWTPPAIRTAKILQKPKTPRNLVEDPSLRRTTPPPPTQGGKGDFYTQYIL